MFQKLFFWLFKDTLLAWSSAWKLFHERLDALHARIGALLTRLEASRRMPVYVTLRGFYYKGDKEVAHGWTVKVCPDENEELFVPFNPFNKFRCERVDVLGPADIMGVNVGNETETLPGYQSPATFEFSATCEVGNRIIVRLKGTP